MKTLQTKKEKYPYQYHAGGISTNDAKSTYRYPIYWRYKNSVEQDFKHGYCSEFCENKLKVGITKLGKYWVHIFKETQDGHGVTSKSWIVYCNEIEWLYQEDMKPVVPAS